MSENVELITRAIHAFNSRDSQTLANLVTPDFELFTAIIGAVEGGSYRGRDGLAMYFDAVSDAWEDIRMVADELRDLGNSVLVLGRLEGRGRGSGVEIDAPLGVVDDLRDGRISRVRAYLDHGEALRAAGLAK